MTDIEKKYLKMKILKYASSKNEIAKYLALDNMDKLKGTIKEFFASEYKMDINPMDSLFNDKFSTMYTKIEDSFRTKYKFYIFSLLKKNNYSGIDSEISWDHFSKFKITEQIIEDYVCNYYQDKFSKLNAKNIYNTIKIYVRKKSFAILKDEPQNEYEFYKNLYDKLKIQYINMALESLFTIEKWQEMIETSKCCYCGVTEEQIDSLRENQNIFSKSGRGFKLEIDRKYPNLEYTSGNCCMSCYWCNNAKTDEFSSDEFKEIAKGINTIWNIRLGGTGFNDIVKFPTNVC